MPSQKDSAMNLLETLGMSLFSGALQLRRDNDGACLPLRFTPSQIEYYGKIEIFRIRSECCAGICLRVRTDAEEIGLDFSYEQGARGYYGLAVEKDGNLIHQFHSPQQMNGRMSVSVPLGKDDEPREITIYLSQIRPVRIHAVTVADGCVAEAVTPAPKKLLCLGDSITQGMSSAIPAVTYATALSRILKMDILNQAVGGHYYDADSLDATIDYKPDLITVAYGTNDWTGNVREQTIRSNVTSYLQKLAQIFPAVKTVVITPLWRSDHHAVHDGGLFKDFCQAIADTAASFGNVYLLNGYHMIPHHGDYYVDGLHPNDLGALWLASRLAAEINRLGLV